MIMPITSRKVFNTKSTFVFDSFGNGSDFRRNSVSMNRKEAMKHNRFPAYLEMSETKLNALALKRNARFNPMRKNGIVAMIHKRKWDTLEEHIKTSVGQSEVASRSKERDRNNGTILHLLCQHNPPACLTEAFVELCPDLVGTTDHNLWTPLHTAIAFSANPSVVECLLRANDTSALIHDKAGMIPLAIEAQKSDSDAGVVRLLIEANPASTLFGDKSGRIPYEHAVEAKASTRVLDSVYSATKEAMEERMVTDLGRGHCCREKMSLFSHSNSFFAMTKDGPCKVVQ